jgi:hypothetical protein
VILATTVAAAVALALAATSLGIAASSETSSPVLDIHITPGALDIAIVLPVADVARELSIHPPESVLQPEILAREGDSVVWLVKQRLQISAGTRSLGEGSWSEPEPLPEQQSLRLRAHYDVGGPTGTVSISAQLFPHDRTHQTFVNIYEGDALQTKAILDGRHPRFLYFAASRE